MRINEFEEEFREQTKVFTPAILKTLKTEFWDLRLPYAPAHSSREEIIIGKKDADKGLERAYKLLVVYLSMFANAQSELRRRMGSEIERLIGKVLPTIFILEGGDVDPLLESADVDPLAEHVRARIAAANLSVWPPPDRSLGADGRNAVSGILAQTRVMVVAATASALQSPEVREAWRRARQLGVIVVAISEAPLDQALMDAVPGWMKRSQFLVLDRDWTKILDCLNTVVPATRVPQMAPSPSADSIPRPRELRLLKDTLLASQPASLRVALYGAPGSGKTALAKALAADDDVQSFFTDGILWINASDASNVMDELAKVHLALTGEPSTFTHAGETLSALQSRLGSARCLIVLDNLESTERLRDVAFLPSCRYLMTTNDRRVATAAEGTPLPIGVLELDEAFAILRQVAAIPQDEIGPIIEAVGTLPLALRIVAATATARLTPSTAHLVSEVDATLKAPYAKVFERLTAAERVRAADLVFSTADGSVDVEQVWRIWHVDGLEGMRTLTRLADLALVSIAGDHRTVVLDRYARRAIAAATPERDLNRILDEAMARVPADQFERARRVLCRLVRINDLSDLEPRTIRASELPNDQLDVLDTLARLDVIARGHDVTGEHTVALANAAACRQWQQLRKWIDADREFLGWRQRLGAYVANWQRTNDGGALLVGTLMAEGLQWQAARRDELSDAENAYIRESDRAARSITAAPSFVEPTAKAAGARAWLVGTVVMALIGATALGLYRRTASPPPSTTQVMAVEDPDVSQGDLFASKGDRMLAIRAYSTALARLPRDADLYYKRGVAYARDPNDGAKALEDFNRALELAPTRADVLAARGAVRLSLGDTAGALADLDAAVSRDPRNPQAFYARAGARAATGNRDGAIDDYSTAIKLLPSLANAYLGRAGLYEAVGKRALAISDLDQVVKISDDALTVRTAQGRLAKLGPPMSPETAATVNLQFQNERDKSLADAVAAYLTTRGQKVAAVQHAPATAAQTTTGGEVRFLPQDRAAALRTKEAVQNALADQGIRLELRTTPLATPGATAGRIEVSLPSLVQKQ